MSRSTLEYLRYWQNDLVPLIVMAPSLTHITYTKAALIY